MSALPEEYCPFCANERPDEFRFIREAEERGAIVFTGHCARHLIMFLNSQPGLTNARLESGKVLVDFVASSNRVGEWEAEILPESGMKWREARFRSSSSKARRAA